uniref:P-type ATPase A domain-containing protein n=1 Tax=Hucho hucho TaxID=62062 RepID=A0A4W5L8Z6_9TELE
MALLGKGDAPAWLTGSIALWLWFTVLFANFAEALAEGRSKAQAASLKGLQKATWAKKLAAPHNFGAAFAMVESSELRKGDVILVQQGEVIACDGEVIEGIASVDESAITGESAPVIRESGGDFSSVTGGTRVLSDWIIVRATVNPGETFIDRMIAMVEGAKRRKTPNEIALTILLGAVISLPVLLALLVCLIPTTIGGLLSAIGVAGMSRLMAANVIATSGRAVEAAGDVDVLLLDKTGTITFGNRQASAFVAAAGVSQQQLAEAAWLASLADDTPEGKSIVLLAQQQFGAAASHFEGVQSESKVGRSLLADLQHGLTPAGATFVPFTAQSRMSGVNVAGRQIRKGASDAIRRYVDTLGGALGKTLQQQIDAIASRGSTPLVVAEGAQVLGVIELKDIVKPGIRERFAQLRQMGIKTVMITGDNRLTAAAIAAEAGVDDFLAEATPEAKLALIRDYQKRGQLVAMTGDGTNDAPALAQADVAVAMNSGTQAAREAANMVDLDSSPTKLIEVVEIGKQMLMTPASALLSAVIFNALIIIALIPLALKGVRYRALGAEALLKRNLL